LSWKLIPLEAIDRIEILRGGSTALYGEGSIGGVINIILKKGTAKKQNQIAVEGGGYNWGKLSLSSSGPLESNPQNQYYISVSRESLGGYRQNGFYQGTQVFTKLNSTIDQSSDFQISMQVHDDRTGIAGNITATEFASDPAKQSVTLCYIGAPSPCYILGDHFENRLIQFNVQYQKQFSEKFKQSHSVYARNRRNDSVVNGSAGSQYISADSLGVISQSEWRQFLGADTFIAGGEFSEEKSLSTGFSTDAIKRDTTALFLSADYALSSSLWFNAGLRGDFIAWNINSTSTTLKNRQAQALSPKMSLTQSFWENSKMYVAAYQTFRGPQANTFFFAATGFLPNLNIQPETAKTYEAGIKLHGLRLPEMSLNVFHTDIDQEILFDSITLSDQNFNSFHEGVELAFKPNLNDQWSMGLEATWLRAQFVGGAYDKKNIPLSPGQNRVLSLHYKLSSQSHLSLLWNRIADQYVLNDFNNVFQPETYETLDGKWDYQNGDFGAYITLKNINETKYSAYSVSNGTNTLKYNPGLGRHILIGFSQRF
jgi:outer membrane receptor protein involved in Fe transport